MRGAGRFHQVLSYQERVEAGRAEAVHRGYGMNAALGHFHDTGRDALGQPQRGLDIHDERLQIAIVDTDDVGAGFESDIDFGFVMGLDERGHSVTGGKFPKRADASRVENRDDQKNGVGAVGGGFDDVIFVEGEVLAQDWQRDRFAGGEEVGKAALKKMLVGEDGKRRRASGFVLVGEGRGVEIRAQQTFAWGCLFNLSDDRGGLFQQRATEIAAARTERVGLPLPFRERSGR